MKRVLIIGANSYVGQNFKRYLEEKPSQKLETDQISVRDEEWKKVDFGRYDSLLYLAGIVHQKERTLTRELYERVNSTLPYEIARKARSAGAGQFIYMSTMSVYGLNTGIIGSETEPKPRSWYGETKLEGEKRLETLRDRKFKVAVIRPPMIYGKGCKGNYARLSKLVRRIGIFPKVRNQRSMIYIDNLCELMYQLIKGGEEGLYLPQNQEYVCTSDLVKEIRRKYGRKTLLIPLPDRMTCNVIKHSRIMRKVFGDLVYEEGISQARGYCVENFEESIEKTEGTG